MVLRSDWRMGWLLCEKRWGKAQTRERGKSEFWLKTREIWPKSEFSQRNLWKNGC